MLRRKAQQISCQGDCLREGFPSVGIHNNADDKKNGNIKKEIIIINNRSIHGIESDSVDP
jgi:hypothetical protein